MQSQLQRHNKIGRMIQQSILWLALLIALPSLVRAQDTAPPSFASFAISPTNMDISATSHVITITANILDDLSGVKGNIGPVMRFESPSGNQSIHPQTWGDPVSGSITDGVFQCSVTLPQYSETGVWKLDMCRIFDLSGNETNYTYATMVTNGFNVEFLVTGASDTAPPSFASFAISPTNMDISATSHVITITANILDDLSGVKGNIGPVMRFESPSGNQSIHPQTWGDPVSGSITDGVFQCSVTLPQYSETGVWKLDMCRIFDLSGNETNYTYATMVTNGFNVEFLVVVSDSDADALPDWWEQLYFGSVENASPDQDPDQDGFPNLSEYIAGTVPTNRLSTLCISPTLNLNAAHILSWETTTGRVYVVQTSTNLAKESWIDAAMHTNSAMTNQTMTWTNAVLDANPSFYRVNVSGVGK